MHNTTKKGLLIFLLIVLLFPFLQHCLNFIHSGPVFGAYIPAQDTDFTFEDWWSGKFQETKSKYDNDNTGFRPDLIRINNQIDYSLFSKLHFQWGEMGTNGCVWDRLYIEAYLGKDFLGHNKILGTMQKLKKIQDTLGALGKTVVVIYAPSKGSYYPEYLPVKYKKEKKGITNLETFGHIGDSLGINQVNFNEWFLKLKSSTSEVLYPMQGIHWSLYGATLAADSFVRYMNIRHSMNMQRIKWISLTHEHAARETDDDIGRQLNLVVPISNEVFRVNGQNSGCNRL